MLLCTKIRLQVSEADAAALEFMQGKCRGLYNWWVMRLRDGEQWPGWVEAKATLEASKEHDPELRFVYGKLLHEVYFRLDRAMAAFFRRVKVGVDEDPASPASARGMLSSPSATQRCMSRWKAIDSICRPAVVAGQASPSGIPTLWLGLRSLHPPTIGKWRSLVMRVATTMLRL